VSRCRLCAARLEPFVSFGRMPLANGFLRREDFADEFFFDLGAAFCEACAMPQLVESVAREKMFNERYPFFTASSTRMAAHFKDLAAQVMRDRLAERDPFVVEIGSNDGTLLQHVAASGIRHLGVEPSSNVAAAAGQKGVLSTSRFFDEALACGIVRDHGCADVILAANCFCHVEDLRGLAAGVERLLKPRGLLIFEDPYLGDIVANAAYDQIYDEHTYYFCVAGVARWLERHELEIVDVAPQPVHGGSMRYTVARRGARPVEASVRAHLNREAQAGLLRRETYERLRGRIEASREALVALLRRLKREGKRVAGYGATSKSTTVLNYCAITPDLIEFISDTTPIKQGRFSPGMHIPVRAHAEFVSRYPDHAVLFAWNHGAEIMQKESAYRSGGGKWIAYVPEVKVLD
jgi:methylation protein EvaC